MHAGQAVLLAAAALLLVARLVRALRQGRSVDETTYDEPALQLDAEVEGPHDVFGELASTLKADQDADRRYLESRLAKEQTHDAKLSAKLPVSRKMLLTLVSVVLVVALPYLVPQLAWLRLLSEPDAGAGMQPAPEQAGGPLPSASVGEAKLPGATLDQEARGKELEAPLPDARGPIAQGKNEPPAEFAPAKEEKKPPRPIDDPSGKALDAFFAKLARVENDEPGATARVLYFGDSIVASDFVTGKLRRMLQDRFGEGGHGYAIIANAWPGWFHIDVSRKASADWGVSTCVGPYAKDGLYGLGCASFTSHHKGVWTEIGTATLDKWGRKVSSFEIEYLKQPDGGAFDVVIDGNKRETVETASDETQVAYHRVKVEDAAHTLKIVSADDRPVRMFGIRMERDEPGITLSAMGITGARARFLDKQDDEHFARVLQAAKPDLVALAFGSNEITDGLMYPVKDYRETLVAVMEQVEKAVPNASLMLVGPPDMASKNAAWGHSRPMANIIAKNQKELAAERGWAFWDQYHAMGGGGSMWSWIQAGLGSQDMFHPTGQGGNLLGRWQYLALMEAFETYKAKHR